MAGLLVYLVGAPGAGKSTVMAELNSGRSRHQQERPIPYMTLTDAPDGLPGLYVELGRQRKGFSGTDALAMNVQPKALDFLDSCAQTLVIGEGDRLGNRAFFEGARAKGWVVRVVWLDTPESLAILRRGQRGSRQNPSWVAGRITKARKLGMTADLVLHGAIPARENASYLREKIRQWLKERYS